MFGKLFKKKVKPSSQRPVSELVQRALETVQTPKDISGWSTFTKEAGIDKLSGYEKRQAFLERMAFRDETLGIGRSAPR